MTNINPTPLDSGELPTIEYFLEKIGGSDEYKGAVLVAALLHTFSKSITYYNMTKWDDAFEIEVEIGNVFSLDAKFRNIYLYLFEEEGKRWT